MSAWNNVSFSYESKTIFKEISLNFSKTKKYFVIGNNGCGKTTFLKLCMHYIKPHAGKIESFPKSFSYVPANNQLHPCLRVEDLIDLYTDKKAFSKNLYYQKFNIGELEEQAFLSMLSSGQRQRLLLALSFAKKSEVLYLDEPFSHLDFEYQLSLVEALNQCKKQIFLVSHNLPLALELEDCAVLLLDGTDIHDLGPCKQAFSQPEFEKTFQLKAQITDNPINGKQLLALAKK